MATVDRARKLYEKLRLPFTILTAVVALAALMLVQLFPSNSFANFIPGLFAVALLSIIVGAGLLRYLQRDANVDRTVNSLREKFETYAAVSDAAAESFAQLVAEAKENVELRKTLEEIQGRRRVNEDVEQPIGNPPTSFPSEFAELKDKVESLTSGEAYLKRHNIEADEREKLIADLKSRIETESASGVIKSIEERLKPGLQQDALLAVVDKALVSTSDRLYRETRELGRRGNLNLVIGINTTAIGLMVLTYVVFTGHSDSESKDYLLIALYYLPKLTLVLFIELFAYFFLNLYKSSLSEIKYFQNEITNVESKLTAIRVATFRADNEATKDVIANLVRTERNFVLGKDQSTIDLEKARLDRQSTSELMGMISGIVDKIKK